MYHRRILVSYIILILPFILARLYWYIVFPLPGIASDSSGYMEAAYAILSGDWPLFDFRNPGYPLLLVLPLALGKGLGTVVLMQSLLTLLAALLLVLELHRSLGRAAIVCAIALSLFLITDQQLSFETSLLSDAPFTALLMLFMAIFLRSLRLGSLSSALLLLFVWAFLLLLRPVSVFLIPLLLVWTWLGIRNGRSRQVLAAFCLAVGMWTGVSTYNLATCGRFGLSSTSALNAFGSTISYAAPGPSYPLALSLGISQVMEDLNMEEAEALRNSTDPRKVMSVYTACYENMWPVLQSVQQELQEKGQCQDARISCLYPMLKQLRNETIAANPGLFLRYWIMSVALTSIRNRCDWKSGLPNILDQRRESLKEKNLPNILDPSLQHNAWMLNRMAIDQARIPEEGKKTPTVFRAVSYIQTWLNSLIFFNYGWVWTLICILGAGYAIFRYLFRQDRRIDVLLLLTLSLSWMAYTLISTAFVYPLERLSYPLEWMRYLCAILTIRFSLPSFHLSHFKAFP